MRRAGSHATTGPRHISGVVPHWPLVRLGGQGLVGRDRKMRARKDGPNVVGSCLAGPALPAPRIAPTFKMFADPRVGALALAVAMLLGPIGLLKS